jgi:hypothetical protein
MTKIHAKRQKAYATAVISKVDSNYAVTAYLDSYITSAILKNDSIFLKKLGGYKKQTFDIIFGAKDIIYLP